MHAPHLIVRAEQIFVVEYLTEDEWAVTELGTRKLDGFEADRNGDELGMDAQCRERLGRVGGANVDIRDAVAVGRQDLGDLCSDFGVSGAAALEQHYDLGRLRSMRRR
jgi:hypothetical protein